MARSRPEGHGPPVVCPCGRHERRGVVFAYADCCGPYLAAESPVAAPDAERLMRSRYTAYVTGRADYLLATWHPAHRPATLSLDPHVRWLGLDVRSCRAIDAEHAEVEFVARSALHGRATRLHETSRFLREDGRWYYIDGDLG